MRVFLINSNEILVKSQLLYFYDKKRAIGCNDSYTEPMAYILNQAIASSSA